MKPQCGTYSGYQLHKRKGTMPCEPCRGANAVWQRDYRRRRGLSLTVRVPVHIVEDAASQCLPGTARALRACLDGGS